MNASEMAIDEKYKTEGWYAFSNGWPDRAYARIRNGKLEVRFVEIKSPTDALSPDQRLMHAILLSQRLKVEIEPANKAPKDSTLPIDVLLKALKLLEENRMISS
jgi:VRR-NUC domain